MTRLMYWNINAFGHGALFGQRPGDPDPEWDAPADQNAIDRRTLLLDLVEALEPDIISIVEVQPGAGAPAQGTPIADNTAFELLQLLRNVAGEFQLVPPLVSGTGGRAEAVAVYYKGDELDFLGPWGFGGAAADTVANLGGVAGLAHYNPADWGAGGNAALPNRTIAAGWPNAGCPEDHLAGQWSFGATEFAVAGNRRPWLTSFGHAAGPAGPRVINLFSFHAPPDQLPPAPVPGAAVAAPPLAAAVAGTAAVAGLPEVAGVIGANEVRCIVGDFNISTFDAASDPNSYQLFRNAGYAQGLYPLAPPNPVPYEWPEIGYYATHVRSKADANPWIDVGIDEDRRGYPGFGYVSSVGGFGWYDSIDNVFTRYGAAAGGPATDMTIVNPVIGSPYNVGPAGPPNVLLGTVQVPSMMADPGVFQYDAAHGWAGISEYGNDDIADEARETFVEWPNYHKIRSLSDHLPLFIDI